MMNNLTRTLERTMSLTDKNSSSHISDAVLRDLTNPADRGKHRYFLNMPKHDLVLPSLSRFDTDFRKFFFSKIVDFDVQKALEEARCLNWCTPLQNFIPILTIGDGNCLMNAASLSMWAINDRRLTLRKTVFQVLVEDETDTFRHRWELECRENLENQHGSPVDCSSEESAEDWRRTVDLASTKKLTDTNCYASLEEIHIFVLANVLRRPIIILCDDVFRGNYDESLANVNLGGVYLPLLCDSVDCVMSPLVLGYHGGHFTALVSTEDGNLHGCADGMAQKKNTIPLVKWDGAPMKLHFLLRDERQNSDRLLREYLECGKIECENENGGSGAILVAVMQQQEPEAHIHEMFKTYFDALQETYCQMLAEKSGSESSQFAASPGILLPEPPCCASHKKCRTVDCTNYAKKPEVLCHKCKESKAKRCLTPDCMFAGNPEYQGLCSSCYAKYHAILEEGKATPKPSAPPANYCRTHNCKGVGNADLHYWCIDCYLAAVQQSGAEEFKKAVSRVHHAPVTETTSIHHTGVNANTPPGANPPALRPSYSRQVSLFCHGENCHNPLEGSERYYCRECMAKMGEDEPMPSICSFPGCSNDLPSGNASGLCNGCISNMQATAAGSKTPGKEKPSGVVRICKISGCTMPAVTYHGELCLAHYNRSLSVHREQQLHREEENSKSAICMTEGCRYYGIPENNYLCSRCHAKALQELYDMEKIMAEQERAKREWFLRNSQVADPYGPSDDIYRPREQFLQNASAYRKAVYLQAPSSAGYRSMSAPASPTLRRRFPSPGTPCATQGCGHFSEAGSKLCLECLERQQFGRSASPRRSRFCSDP